MQGHTVTAFVRDPGKLDVESDALQVVIGDVLERNLVEQAVWGQDVVVCALGVGSDVRPAPVLSEGTRHIIQAMEKYHVKRLICLLSGWLFFQSTPPMFKAITAEHRRQYTILQQSAVDWIAVCPPQITDYPPIGSYRTAVDRLPDGGYRISKEELAEFMMTQLVVNDFLRRAVGIAN
jgi:putative NADH-flavin reductase